MKARTSQRRITDSYFDLIRQFPLRRIRDDASHSQAARMIRTLLLRGEDHLDSGEVDYLEALAEFVENYEQNRFKVNKPSPIQILKHLMEVHGMKHADLGKLIGSSAASMVLHGERELSKSHIRKLAEHFKVDPGLFF